MMREYPSILHQSIPPNEKKWNVTNSQYERTMECNKKVILAQTLHESTFLNVLGRRNDWSLWLLLLAVTWKARADSCGGALQSTGTSDINIQFACACIEAKKRKVRGQTVKNGWGGGGTRTACALFNFSQSILCVRTGWDVFFCLITWYTQILSSRQMAVSSEI